MLGLCLGEAIQGRVTRSDDNPALKYAALVRVP
jgi:hypothetical protein